MTGKSRKKIFFSDLNAFVLKTLYLILAVLCLALADGRACTSAVISSRASADGRPVLWKHRDTGALDNRLEHFKGPEYSFTGLVNSSSVSAGYLEEGEREVWMGANTAGFALMNTASYNLKDDNVPSSLMDREGVIIFKALGVCGSLEEFEAFLDTLPRPIGVEANFGAIDAFGGAAYYEVNNNSWIKYDVNNPETAPDGYMVVTNFSFSGREEDRKGYERYLTASAIFSERSDSGILFDIPFLFDGVSRSFRHEFLGFDYSRDYDKMKESGFCNGIVVDQDFIPRRSTSASVAVQGVKRGEPVSHIVMWALLGYPVCGTVIPVPVSVGNIIPDYLCASPVSHNALMCDLALSVKNRFVFRFNSSSGRSYLDLDAVIGGRDGRPSLVSCASESDEEIRKKFDVVFNEYLSGRCSYGQYLEEYKAISSEFIDIYTNNFKSYLSEE